MAEIIIPAKSDFMFKKIFADENNSADLVKMLKAFLTDIPKEEFSIVSLRDPSLLPDNMEGKLCILDLLVKTRSDFYIHVEIQVRGSVEFIKRVIYYNANLIVKQLSSGQHYKNIKRSISIYITDFNCVEDGEYFHRFRYYDRANDKELTDLTEVIIIELPKVPEANDETSVWLWAKLFSAQTREELDMLNTSEETAGAVATIIKYSKDDEARIRYELELRAERDTFMYLDSARREGQAEGEAKGRAEGEAKGRAEGEAKIKNVALEMLADGLSPERVVQYTGLPLGEIEKLKNS
jgi:predicted transposase/invertase (TIGR01784 family)